ncbi:MAG: AAA family ATPase [Clostridia bacterium]|nr:AAA family ATPase [Clostridia bacterium]
MKKMNLYFDVRDTEYFERLKKYILLNNGNLLGIAKAREELNGGYLVSDYLNKRNTRNIIIFGEGKDELSKYQKASAICNVFLDRYSEDSGEYIEAGKGGARIICVTSALGGAGKSTASKAICCRLAERGRKVLYVNLDSLSSGETVFGQAESNNCTRMRYFMRKHEGEMAARIKSLAARDERRRVDYISNGRPSMDGPIEEAEAEWFASAVTGSSIYEYVVLDIPSCLSEGHIKLMKEASLNIIIRRGETGRRQRNFSEYLESLAIKKVIEASNFSEDGEYAIPSSEGIFEAYPRKYWICIDLLCDLVEEA